MDDHSPVSPQPSVDAVVIELMAFVDAMRGGGQTATELGVHRMDAKAAFKLLGRLFSATRW